MCLQANPLPPLVSAGCSFTANETPLFSSPAHENFAIKAPSTSISFDWSDFPVLSQYHEEMPERPYASPSPLFPPRSCSHQRMCSWDAAPNVWEVSDDELSFSLSSDDEDDTVLEPAARPQEEQVRAKNPNKKSVTFASILEIRSHNVVLGDHPCCSSLALELSWDHEEAEVVDFDLYESSRQYQRRHLRALRLSYWDRRRLLEASTGLSEQELLLQEQRAWREHLLLGSQSCSHEASCSVLKKVSSTKTLASLTA